MKIKILKYYAGETPIFERYTSPVKVPCYDDIKGGL